MQSELFLFFHPDFPGSKLFTRDSPDLDIRSNHWHVNPWNLNPNDKPGDPSKTLWTAGRLNYCDLIFRFQEKDSPRLSRIHFSIRFELLNPEEALGKFTIFSGGSYVTKSGKTEYWESSIGVWVWCSTHWVKVDTRGVELEPGVNNRIWLGVNEPEGSNAAIFVANSPSPTINPEQLWEEGWPKESIFMPKEVIPKETVQSNYLSSLAIREERDSTPENRWTAVVSFIKWIQMPPTREDKLWKIFVYISVYLLIGALLFSALLIYWDLNRK